MKLLHIILVLLLSSCINRDLETVKNNHSYAIYLTKNDAQNRYNLHLNDLDEIELQEQPLFTDRDILEYDWDTQTILLKEGINHNITHNRFPTGTPFVVVADGVKCYIGYFWSSASSLSTSLPIINTWQPAPNKFQILRHYPSFAHGLLTTNDDVRCCPRVAISLKKLEKLSKFRKPKVHVFSYKK